MSPAHFCVKKKILICNNYVFGGLLMISVVPPSVTVIMKH